MTQIKGGFVLKLGKKKDEQTIIEGDVKPKKNIKWVGRFLKRHKGVTILVCIVVIGCVVGVNVFGNTKKVPETAGEMAFETMTLEKRDISNSISVTGTIASADSRTLTSTLTNIDVESLNVAVGDTVNAGDVLVVFDDSDLAEDLSDAKTSLSVSKAQSANNIENAERSYAEASESAEISATRAAENVSSAYSTYTKAVSTEASSKLAYQEAVDAESALETEVAKLEKKVTKLETEISELQTELKSAEESKKSSIQSKITKKEASLATAKAEYEAKNTEYKTAQQETVSAKQTYEQAATSLENSYSSYTKAVQDQEDTTRNNESNLANQASSLENSKLSATNGSKNEEDQVESIQEQIDECTVTSPISGIVTSLSVSADDTFAGGEILTIQDNSSFIVEASVDEYDIADIAKGMSVVVKTDATGDEELEGEVIYVAPTPESSGNSSSSAMGGSSSSSSTYEVQISIKTANDRLRIGMSAKASILTESRENVFAVPYDAIETNENGESVIYVVDTTAKEMPQSTDTETGEEEEAGQKTDGTQKADDTQETDETQEGDREMPQAGENGEMPDMSGNGERPQRGNGEMPDMSNSGAGNMQNKKAIVVEVGLESDYYTEISSDELEEGMLVITGTSSKSAGSSSSDEDNMSGMFGGMGGGMSGGGGGMSGGGGGMGGGPGGR
jgi:multidrug efflux pump subunit AcrA (membrane-fusion protein)